MDKKYNRIMLGAGGKYAAQCKAGDYIGVDFLKDIDLSGYPSSWEDFHKMALPKFIERDPERSKVALGLSCGFLWTTVRELKKGDVVLCPNGQGRYLVGEIDGDYYFVQNEDLPHRRPVKWRDVTIARNDMSEKLRRSTGSIGTCCDVTRYATEIEMLIATGSSATPTPTVVSTPSSLYHERALHRLLCNYLDKDGIFAKTIFHEKSKKDALLKWVHPDIIGVSFSDFNSLSTQQLMKAAEPIKALTLSSYEMKRQINSDYDLKHCFFQALSNSNWANEGYLVAFEISDNLMDEMQRLNDSFGIGIIRLQPRPEDTEVLFPARFHELDYNTIDKLNNANENFRDFITNVSKVLSAGQAYEEASKIVLRGICDETFTSDDEIEQYCIKENIPY